MENFDFWYIYYDALFSSTSPQIPPFLLSRECGKRDLWPQVQPIQLSLSFKNIQDFIKNMENWSHSSCTEQQLLNIEDNLNYLLVFLQIQKDYANQYWKADKRRIQASATHMYIFLQVFVKSIIPYPTMTIFQCKAANKLCVNINKLQNLINLILKSLNPIYKFLKSNLFSEELHLTKNFFQNWIQFLKKLPNIKRDKFSHLPSLIRFINLNNEIQIWQRKNHMKRRKKRRKQNYEEFDRKSDHGSDLSKGRKGKVFNSLVYSVKKQSVSCEPRSETKTEKSIHIPKIFKFSKEISNYSLTEKNQPYKIKRLSTISPVPLRIIELKGKKKSQTIANFENLSPDKSRKNTSATKKRINTIDNQQKFLSSERPKKKASLHTIGKLSSQIIHEQEKEEEKSSPVLQKKKYKAIEKIKQLKNSRIFYEKDKRQEQEVEIETGKKVSKGWQFLRKYIKERIAERKIKRLLGV